MTLDSQNRAPTTAPGDDPGVKKDASIYLRVSQAELDAWQAAAERSHMSLSAWIRQRCNGVSAVDPQLDHVERGVAHARRKRTRKGSK